MRTKIRRYKIKHSRIGDRSIIQKGGDKQCFRCAFYYERWTDFIRKVGAGWLCKYCEDPEDTIN